MIGTGIRGNLMEPSTYYLNNLAKAPTRRRPPRLAHLDRIDARLAGDPPPLTPDQIAEARAQLSGLGVLIVEDDL